eukprot:6951094-Pyramimonas_sp.AAC.1
MRCTSSRRPARLGWPRCGRLPGPSSDASWVGCRGPSAPGIYPGTGGPGSCATRRGPEEAARHRPWEIQ